MDLTDRSILAFVLVSTAAALSAGAAATGCTAAERADVAVASNVASALTPLVCAGITAAGQAAAGSACGTVDTDVSDVSKLVQSIIDSLPPAPPAARALPMAAAPAGFVYRGVALTFPSAELAAQVRARLPGASPATAQ
jgi:hypothetical protein